MTKKVANLIFDLLFTSYGNASDSNWKVIKKELEEIKNSSDNSESFQLLSDIKKVLDGGMDVSIRTGTPSHERVTAAVAQQQNIPS